MDEILTRGLARSQRQRSSLGIVMIDLDHLRQLNDHHGHHVGDRVLKSVARCLQDACRPLDVACC